MDTTHLPLVIAGGGLGGVTLARILSAHGVAAAVLDLEASAAARTQGGMLDIHHDTGQAALRAAGLHEAFLAKVHPGGEALRVLDRHAVPVHEESDGGAPGGRPEIDRGDLRELLLSSLPEGVVRWGAKVSGARPLGDGRHEVALADGRVLTTDLLVGADGAWSRIRPLVTDASPAYTGISFVELDLRDADARHPEAAALVGGGMFFALGDGKGFLGHRETDGSLHLYVALRAGEGWLDTLDFADTPAAKRSVLAHFADWDPALRRLVADADGPLTPRRIHALPAGLRWETRPGVTLLGDAAHLMSPFAGEGANLALFDAAELARHLLERPGDPRTAVAAYEREMFDRAEEKARESAEARDVLFHPKAPAPLAEMFRSGTPEG
ncbi:NAD(P)/FAD-dependent oxidoreductase [Streptomyces sp. NPDC048659]|uniref:FAD-dependent oxidoreductase n=1 Tax=Streptomyces sp. NPDC048659 TaxID=3155489 RepID=UPI00341E9718